MVLYLILFLSLIPTPSLLSSASLTKTNTTFHLHITLQFCHEVYWNFISGSNTLYAWYAIKWKKYYIIVAEVLCQMVTVINFLSVTFESCHGRLTCWVAVHCRCISKITNHTPESCIVDNACLVSVSGNNESYYNIWIMWWKNEVLSNCVVAVYCRCIYTVTNHTPESCIVNRMLVLYQRVTMTNHTITFESCDGRVKCWVAVYCGCINKLHPTHLSLV